MDKRKKLHQKESPEEEIARLLAEIELTQEQREFIESVRQENRNNNNEG